jgi:hypothetical protein
MTTMTKIELIAKEDIPNFHCVTFDVLDTAEARAERKAELEKAMILGNSEHVKYKIIFTTTDGMKEVETTVWATTEDTITLKGGVVIPIAAINKISFL